MKIVTVYTLNSHFYILISQKSRMLLTSTELFFEATSTKSVDPDQSGLVHTVCLYTYVNHLTDIIGCSYFAGVF